MSVVHRFVRRAVRPLARTALCAVAAWLLIGAASALAEQRFPPPDFTDHKLPATTVPAAPANGHQYLDLTVFTLLLCAATWFAVVSRSRKGLLATTVASLLYLGFYRDGCICPIGAIQNVTLAISTSSYLIPGTVVAMFGLPLVVTLLAGRTFCAAVCPLGAMQELVALKPVKVPLWLEHALGLLAYFYLGIAVLFATSGIFLICWYDPFVGFFRLSAGLNMVVLGGAFLLLGVFVARPYCRFLCPYGAILRLLSPLSKWHLRIPPAECINCRLCEDVCPYNAIRTPTTAAVDDRGMARRTVAIALALMPVAIAAGWFVGGKLGYPLARLDPIVRLAERIGKEESGKVEGTTDASDAFRNTGVSRQDLYLDAQRRVERMGVGGHWLGAWFGLVLAGKGVQLAIRRRRGEFEPDRAGCVSCGRCFWYCPKEQERLGLIVLDPAPPIPSQAVPPAPAKQSTSA